MSSHMKGQILCCGQDPFSVAVGRALREPVIAPDSLAVLPETKPWQAALVHAKN